MSRKVDIVIIDSGVYMQHPQISEKVNGYGVKICENNIIIDRNCNDEFGHGTAIYGIIRKHCQEANIIPVKIFQNEEDMADVGVLIATLNFIYENIQCNIINMSVGVSILKEKEELHSICKKLIDKGVIIVAAYDNFGSISYPAEFECVIGVGEGKDCQKAEDFIFVEGTKLVNVLANGNIQRCFWKNPQYQMCGGNSFACAHVTGIIGDNYQEILKKYKGNALKFLENSSLKKISLDIPEFRKKIVNYNGKRAVIFPFNKENHSLIRFSEMLGFKIVDVYDSKYSGKVGAYTNDLLKTALPQNYVIRNIDLIDFSSFDLLIIGHTKELERITNKNGYGKKLIQQSLERNKMVYSYDAYPEFGDISLFFNPNIVWKKDYASPFGKLYRSATPIVGVFGTTSKQGKFSLQVILRNLFLKEGYNVGQIASEPSGLLFGMDYCFPFGYSVRVEVIRKQMVELINKLLHDMDTEKDIILVGCQSSTLPYDCGNTADFTFTQLEFLFSTWPDCIVLCVNSFDEYNDIRRTINFVEAAVKTKVVALVIFPMKLRNPSAGIYSETLEMGELEKREYMEKFSREFNLPTFILGENMYSLYDLLIRFFE